MSIFRRSTPQASGRTAVAQERLASIGEMMSARTQAACAAAAAAVSVAGRSGDRQTVTIAGMRQVAIVNFDMLMEFEVTVLPDGRPPYPATAQQLVSPRQARQLVPGLSLEASVDPANPATIWLDLGGLN
jgi:hypothetical protein